MRVCAVHGCPDVYEGSNSKCPRHRAAADRGRGNARERGYNTAGHQHFRGAVLERDPICVLCDAVFATVADHHPHSRRELEAAGLNPNDPQYGRGLCHDCHSIETAKHQPGGFNRR
jgi:5-methylcytosine-specific restriction protein A